MSVLNKLKFKHYFFILVVLSTFFDLITFLVSRTKAFETNPVYLITGSILVVVTIKLLVMCCIGYLLFKAPKFKVVQFFYVTVAFYLILAQIFGGVSNIKVHNENPPESHILPQDKAIETYGYGVLLNFYMPTIYSLLIFVIWGLCYDRTTKK